MDRQEQIEALKKEISEKRKLLKELQDSKVVCGRVEYENCGSYGNVFLRVCYSEVHNLTKERRTRIASVKDKDKIAYIDELIKDLTNLKNSLSHADS